MKKIALIYMGGTFGCIGEPLSPMPAEHFIPQLQQILPAHLAIECFVAPAIIDSSACTAENWLQLIQMIQQLQLQAYQYFVVLHGTDTLSYASATLAGFLGSSAHVVLTGSQSPLLDETGQATRKITDAIDNLYFALNSVTTTAAGVYLAFHQQLIYAQSALKKHSTELDAFAGIDIRHHVQLQQRNHPVCEADVIKARAFNCLSVMAQPIAIEQQIINFKNLQRHPPHVLILQGFGTGNWAMNEDLIQTLQDIQAQGCAIILTTQVPFGPMEQRYAVNSWMQHAHILISDCLGHADLYAKALKMYLQYDTVEQWHVHWHE